MYFSNVFLKCISKMYFSTVFLYCISQLYFSYVFLYCISHMYLPPVNYQQPSRAPHITFLTLSFHSLSLSSFPPSSLIFYLSFLFFLSCINSFIFYLSFFLFFSHLLIIIIFAVRAFFHLRRKLFFFFIFNRSSFSFFISDRSSLSFSAPTGALFCDNPPFLDLYSHNSAQRHNVTTVTVNSISINKAHKAQQYQQCSLTRYIFRSIRDIGCSSLICTGCFFNWYPPKKLKYGKPRLGESTLTQNGLDTPNLAQINFFVLGTFPKIHHFWRCHPSLRCIQADLRRRRFT